MRERDEGKPARQGPNLRATNQAASPDKHEADWKRDAQEVEAYYEKYLRLAHPEMDEKEIEWSIGHDLQKKHLRRFFETMMDRDRELRRERPEHTTWYEEVLRRQEPL
jgi:hypothetical protein